MTDKNNNMLIDEGQGQDDDIKALFSAFDGVSANSSMKASALDSILARASEAGGVANKNADENASAGNVLKLSDEALRKPPRFRARKVLIVAIAACMAFGLMGGAAYAAPVSYYEFEQDGDTVELGMNCFGQAVSIKADSEAGRDKIEGIDIRHKPREEAVEIVLAAMEAKDQQHPIEYGPHGGERKTKEPPEAAEHDRLIDRGDMTSDGGQRPESEPEKGCDGSKNPGRSEIAPDSAKEGQGAFLGNPNEMEMHRDGDAGSAPADGEIPREGRDEKPVNVGAAPG